MAKITDTDGMLIDGCAATRCIDTAGEIIEIKGVDCSQMEDDAGILINAEHLAGEEGDNTIVGKVVYLKKIYSEGDCEDDRQRFYYEKIKKHPYIYVICRLFDASGHKNAELIAASIRDNVKHGEPIACRFSIEGSTTLRGKGSESNIIKESIFKRLAATFSPANRTAISGLLQDGKNKIKKSVGGWTEIDCDPIFKKEDLGKSTIAGNYDVAPSQLTGGASLQRERFVTNQVKAVLRDYPHKSDKQFNKKKFKDFAKSQLKEVSDSFSDYFTDLAEKIHLNPLAKSEIMDDLEFPQIHDLINNIITLRKSADEILNPQIQFPVVHAVDINHNGKKHRAGRYLVFNGHAHHLEDYFGIMDRIQPKGPTSLGLENHGFINPTVSISEHQAQLEPNADQAPADLTQPEVPEHEVSVDPVPTPPAVFDYQRIGMMRPHVIAFSGSGAELDGQELDQDEIHLILENIANGLGTLRYRSGTDSMSKAEELRKDDGEEIQHTPEQALAHISAAVKAGHVHPSVEQALRQHIMMDPKTGLGNAYSHEQFKKRTDRGGVHLMLDMNNLKRINDDTQGKHASGDAAIKAFGGAMRAAADKVGGMKGAARHGGDEFFIHAPTHEHAAHFVRELRNHLEKLPAIEGTHRISASIGMGHTPEHADQALYAAKAQKFDPKTGAQNYTPGNIPHILAHSLVSGHEGPVPMSNEHNPATPPKPKAPVAPKPAASP